jgi:hypothetical protein
VNFVDPYTEPGVLQLWRDVRESDKEELDRLRAELMGPAPHVKVLDCAFAIILPCKAGKTASEVRVALEAIP